MHILHMILFWTLVLGASGLYASFTKTKKEVIGSTSHKIVFGTEDPMVRVAFAILALVFRPW